MIRIEYEEFTIDVPIERRMTVDQFLSVADRLERIAGRVHAPVYTQPVQPQFTPAPQFTAAPVEHTWHQEHSLPFDDHEGQHALGVHHTSHSTAATPARPEEFRFEHEDAQRLEYFMDKLSHQLAKLEETHVRLERIERTMADHGIRH